jgi:LmbE family N-acetylglucosaminyl deacetylase
MRNPRRFRQNMPTTTDPTAAEWDEVLGEVSIFQWPATCRIVVVSPHPDDETLGVGGLLAMAAERSLTVVVVSVTNGELAYVHENLASLRRNELTCALSLLSGSEEFEHYYLDIPDGSVARYEIELRNIVRHLLAPGDLVLCPLKDDGHSDHEATARSTIEAAGLAGARVRCFPIWGWRHHQMASSSLRHGERLVLTRLARRRKQQAVACFKSQVGNVDSVVPPQMLEHFNRDFEILVDPSVR